MPIYFVATVTRYVLVEAIDEAAARIAGKVELHTLYADLRERLGRDIPIEIHTLRLATEGEIDSWRWHQETLAREAEGQARQNPA